MANPLNLHCHKRRGVHVFLPSIFGRSHAGRALMTTQPEKTPRSSE